MFNPRPRVYCRFRRTPEEFGSIAGLTISWQSVEAPFDGELGQDVVAEDMAHPPSCNSTARLRGRIAYRRCRNGGSLSMAA